MRDGFRVTFDVVTPESASRGDVAAAGFLNSAGERIPALIGRPTPGVGMPLRAALELFDCGCVEDSGGGWWSEADSRCDYRTGAEERRALHPPERISAASWARLDRIARGLQPFAPATTH